MLSEQIVKRHTCLIDRSIANTTWIRKKLKNTDIEDHEIRYRSKKTSISLLSYTDIEGAFVDIEKSSKSVYNDIELLNFDIDVFFVIVMSRYRSFMLRYRQFFDIVLDRYRMFLPSISMFSRFRALDIEFQSIQYQV